MKKAMWRAFLNYEKEEAWLNALSAKGLAFESYFLFRYAFAESAPGAYIYRIELLERMPAHPESQEYLRFMAESGVEHIASWGRWVYFRKKAADGPFDIYSDIDSRIAHYKRIWLLWMPIMVLDLAMGLNQVLQGIGFLREENAVRWRCFVVGGLALGMGILLLCSSLAIGKKIKRLRLERGLRE